MPPTLMISAAPVGAARFESVTFLMNEVLMTTPDVSTCSVQVERFGCRWLGTYTTPYPRRKTVFTESAFVASLVIVSDPEISPTLSGQNCIRISAESTIILG